MEHQTATARIYCEECGAGWSEGERLEALETIRWHQTRPFTCCDRPFSPLDDYARAVTRRKADPEAPDPVAAVWEWQESDLFAIYRAKCPCCGGLAVPNEHAGFQASKLYSAWGKDKPSAIARKWIDAQGDDEALQTFWNTQLALPYRPRVGRDIKPSHLMERREVWAGDVPDGVVVITIGVDIQGDRIELEIVGWGRREESWSLGYLVLEGDTALPAVWEHLDEVLQRPMFRADGRPFVAAAVCVDSGDGNRTQEVYAFCKPRRLRKVWAIKGASETSGQRQPVWPTSKANRRSSSAYKPVIIGTNAAKDTISSRLQIEVPGPGYMHFPAERDAGYFEQLTGERLVTKKRGGRRYRVWEPKRGIAHEALDCRVYAYAALWGLVMQHRLDLDREALRVGAVADMPVIRADTPEGQRIATHKQAQQAAPEPEQPAAAPEAKKPPTRKVGRSNWMRSRGAP
ncbi:terminase gpA endonuclease subunit [Azospirillum sp. A26]|uniref:terminase gpA endonuclease subunit n=1 Tax=Azospirillum sp. A26 TaxID=3160607 RepID=UPI00366E112D